MKTFKLNRLLMLLAAFLTMSINLWAETATDALTASSFSLSSSYGAKTGISGANSDAVYACYAMQSTKNTTYPGGDFQMRISGTNKPGAYLVSTTSGGNIRKITVAWADFKGANLSNTSVNIYGSNDAFNSSDYYSAISNGTNLGTINSANATELTISGNFAYFGIVSTGAAYISGFSIEWETSSGPTYTDV